MQYGRKQSDQFCYNSYVELTTGDKLKMYEGLSLENYQAVPPSTIICNQICSYGLFAEQSGNLIQKYFVTSRDLQSRVEVVKRSTEILGQFLSQEITKESVEDAEFEDWGFTRDLMWHDAQQKGLGYLGGVEVYQLEPLTPLKLGVIYPSCYIDWVLEEGEKQIKNRLVKQSMQGRDEEFLRHLRVNTPHVTRKICANGVIDTLLSVSVQEIPELKIITENS